MSPAKSMAMSPPPIAISKERVLGSGRRVRHPRVFKHAGLQLNVPLRITPLISLLYRILFWYKMTPLLMRPCPAQNGAAGLARPCPAQNGAAQITRTCPALNCAAALAAPCPARIDAVAARRLSKCSSVIKLAALDAAPIPLRSRLPQGHAGHRTQGETVFQYLKSRSPAHNNKGCTGGSERERGGAKAKSRMALGVARWLQ